VCFISFLIILAVHIDFGEKRTCKYRMAQTYTDSFLLLIHDIYIDHSHIITGQRIKFNCIVAFIQTILVQSFTPYTHIYQLSCRTFSFYQGGFVLFLFSCYRWHFKVILYRFKYNVLVLD